MLYFSHIDLKTASLKDIKIEIDYLKYLIGPGGNFLLSAAGVKLSAETAELVRSDINILEEAISTTTLIKQAIQLKRSS